MMQAISSFSRELYQLGKNLDSASLGWSNRDSVIEKIKKLPNFDVVSFEDELVEAVYDEISKIDSEFCNTLDSSSLLNSLKDSVSQVRRSSKQEEDPESEKEDDDTGPEPNSDDEGEISDFVEKYFDGGDRLQKRSPHHKWFNVFLNSPAGAFWSGLSFKYRKSAASLAKWQPKVSDFIATCFGLKAFNFICQKLDKKFPNNPLVDWIGLLLASVKGGVVLTVMIYTFLKNPLKMVMKYIKRLLDGVPDDIVPTEPG